MLEYNSYMGLMVKWYHSALWRRGHGIVTR